MSKNIPDRYKPIWATARANSKLYFDKVTAALPSLKLNEAQAKIIHALMALEGCFEFLLASDSVARLKAGKLLGWLFRRHRKGRPPGSQYYLATFVDDVGSTSDRSPIVALKALRDKVYRALSAANINAVCVIEVHPLMNYPGGGEGRTLLFHVHAICWLMEGADAEACINKLLATKGWSNALGAAPIDVKPIQDTPDDLERVSHYLWKAPYSAKNRMPHAKQPDRFLLMDTTSGYRPELALRVLEGLSQIQLIDCMFGVLDGTKVRQDFRSNLTRWHRKRFKACAPVESSFDIWQFWRDLRQRAGSSNFAPYRFIGGGILPRPSKIRKAKSPAATQPKKAERGARKRMEALAKARRRHKEPLI